MNKSIKPNQPNTSSDATPRVDGQWRSDGLAVSPSLVPRSLVSPPNLSELPQPASSSSMLPAPMRVKLPAPRAASALSPSQNGGKDRRGAAPRGRCDQPHIRDQRPHRDCADGRFDAGNPGGPGNPFAAARTDPVMET